MTPAEATAARIAPLIARLAGCSALCDRAAIELTEKTKRALEAHKRYPRDPFLAKNAIALEASSKLCRAAEDLRALRVNVTAIICELEALERG